jgi:uncharacterized cupin superfamily protein
LAEENSSQKVSLFEDFTGRLDIGGALGSAETAMYLYDVEPNESFPYHYEYVEEWLLVVDGAVTVRTAQGESQLQRGDLVRYPPAQKVRIKSRIAVTRRRGCCCSRRRRFPR